MSSTYRKDKMINGIGSQRTGKEMGLTPWVESLPPKKEEHSSVEKGRIDVDVFMYADE